MRIVDLTTEDFVRAEIDKAVHVLEGRISKVEESVKSLKSKIELENALLENRLTKAFGKTMIACTSILLAGIPLVVMLLQKLG